MLDDRHRRLIAVSLEAAAPYGAALGGRNALAVHGLARATSKVIDLVTSREAGPQAVKAVEKALAKAGLEAERYHDPVGLENTWPGGRDSAAQWRVCTPQPHDHPAIGGITAYKCPKCLDRDYLALSRAPRSRDPVNTDLGPVLHPEDAAGQKIGDLARRRLVRDYASASDLLERYSPAQLIGFARRQDPSLSERDFAGLARHLDTAPEIAFTGLGTMTPEQASRLRERFTIWPRDERQVGRAERGDTPERAAPGREHAGRSALPRAHTELRPVPVMQLSERARPGDRQSQAIRPEPVRDLTSAERTAPVATLARQPGTSARQGIPSRTRKREQARDDREIGR